MKNTTSVLSFFFLLIGISNLFSQNLSQSINEQLSELVKNEILTTDDLQWEITSQHKSIKNEVQHIYYRQMIHGLPVFGTDSGIHTQANGVILSANNQFVNFSSFNNKTTNLGLTASQAIMAAAEQLNYTFTEELSIISDFDSSNKKFLFTDGGISLRLIPVQLMYYLTTTNELILVWDITILETDEQNWWNLRIEANSGKIVDKNNYMVFCASEEQVDTHPSELNFNNNLIDITLAETFSETNNRGCTECYEVFALPIENPFYGSRTIEIQPALPAASPFGWHDTDGISGAEFTTTRGNNVDAYEDGDNPGYHPDGGSSLNFSGFPFSEIYTNTNQYEDASITNLFYISNIFHDILYVYGFDEFSGNFQVNNYGNGGIGNDYLIAQGQDGAGQCGANMSTPPDGNSPIMQMTICGDKDGDFDNFILIHEYTHGLSNRLTGGAANTGCLNNMEQMGEGWSDFYGLVLTIEPGDAGSDERDVGTYLFGFGIREFPYSTDFTVNPHTYGAIVTAAIPHGVGSVWTAMLWEMTWTLIDTYGFDPDVYNFTGDITQDAGNVMAIALVTQALKMQPCSPGFVDARDAIFAADLAIYDGVNECLIWEAFARRGLGLSAEQGSPNSVTDGTEAFDFPNVTLNTAEEICLGQGLQSFGGGLPEGGTYSGIGVTDDGNGLIYTFDPAIAGIGFVTITYDAVSLCGTSSQAIDTIEVTDDIPDLECQDVTLTLDTNGEVTLLIEDVVTNLDPNGGPVDNCGLSTSITLSQELFTCDDRGANVITVTLTDTDGNTSNCTPTVTINDPLDVCPPLGTEDNEFDQNLNIFPNPSNGQITIANNSNFEIRSAIIMDINGRTVQNLNVENMGNQTKFSIEKLADGMYFIKIDADNVSVVKRILKN